jgi:pimeloyl-ACP methyl ester carboxylesterase
MHRLLRSSLGFIAGLLLARCLVAAPLPVGAAKIEMPNGTEPLTLYTYKPANYRGGPLIIVFHGVQRNAVDYRDYAITLANRFGAIVVAPHFDKERFPMARYQRGGIQRADGSAAPREQWTYAVVPKLVAFLRNAEGAPQLPYYLIGHSAGGQFLVRLAAFMPGEARRIVAANPGSLVFPSTEQDFGYGFGGLPPELSDESVIRAYLAAPLTLYLGTGDVTPEHSMDVTPPAMKQGPHRLARGRACFAAAEALAKAKGWAFNWRKVETPDIDHDAKRMFAAPEVEAALFGAK